MESFHPDLLRARLYGAERAALIGMLRGGPWVWPPPDQGTVLATATALVPEGPPRPRPGLVPLLAVSDRAAALWSFELVVDAASADEGDASIGLTALRAFDHATVALPRALPVLWSSVRQARAARMVVRRLAATGLGAFVPSTPTLDGESFGLSFLLALASFVLDEPVPERFVASAVVRPDGRLGQVDGLNEKLAVLLRRAPRITTILVKAGPETHALAVEHRHRIEIVGLETAAEAVKLVFGERQVALLLRAGDDPRQRTRFVSAFFRLALRGHQEVPDWHPVAEGARLALQSWGSRLGREDRWRLEVAHALAARHTSNSGQLPEFEASALAALAPAVRVGMVANYVQQSADTGMPTPSTIDEIARSYLAPVEEAFGPHLKLYGALARLYAVTGREREALDMQEHVATAWFQSLEHAEVSRPLAEWYRLAGVCGDASAFERAERLHFENAGVGGFGLEGNPWVDLARVRAMLLLGLASHDRAVALLQQLTAPTQPREVRASASRWCIRALEDAGADSSEAIAVLGNEAARGGEQAVLASAFLTLVELDRALRTGDAARAAVAVDALARLQPGPVGNIFRTAVGDQASAVARLFPY